MLLKKLYCFYLLLLHNLLAKQPKLVLPIGHVDKIHFAQFSPDGKMIITASGDHFLLADLTEYGFELMQSLFVNVGKSTGATIISAAAGTQFALERNDLKNGVFTYCILEALKTNTTMKISELKRIVGKRVEELTNGLQKPTSRNETIAVDWNVW